MKSTILTPFTLLLFMSIVSCNKTDDATIPYPSTYNLQGLQLDAWKYFVYTQNGYNEIGPHGYFGYELDFLDSSLVAGNSDWGIPKIKLVNENSLFVFTNNGTGLDSLEVKCSTDGLNVTWLIDSTNTANNPIFKYEPDAHILRRRSPAYFFSYQNNGTTDYSALVQDIYEPDATYDNVLSSVRTKFNLQAGDSIEVNLADLIYKE